jgi:hypothetical protein
VRVLPPEESDGGEWRPLPWILKVAADALREVGDFNPWLLGWGFDDIELLERLFLAHHTQKTVLRPLTADPGQLVGLRDGTDAPLPFIGKGWRLMPILNGLCAPLRPVGVSARPGRTLSRKTD